MKKVFLFLATAALFASCADDMLEPGNGFQASNEKGITFQVVKDDPATRGMLEKIEGTEKYTSFFFAEQDQVSIWAANAKLADEALGAYANGELSSVAIYKATKSETNPYLTAIDNENLLGLIDYKPGEKPVTTTGEFFAAYPTEQTVSYVAAVKDKNPAYFTITASDLSQQKYGGYMNMDARLMYAYNTGSKNSDSPKEQNKSVGESVPLAFQSPLSTARFLIKDLKSYESCKFGKLQSITLESQYTPLLPDHQGGTVDEKDLIKVGDKTYLEGDLTPSFDDKGNLKYTVNKKADGKTDVDPTATETALDPDYFTFTPSKGNEMAYVSNKRYIKSATLTVNRAVGEDEEMNLFVLPTTCHSANLKEAYTITYTFDNVTLKYTTGATGDNFAANTGSIQFPLTIANKFDYIVTEGKSKSLIVNKGEFSKIFGTGDNANKVSWAGDYIDPSAFTSILINEKVAALTENDFAKLRYFTAATNLKILNETGKLESLNKVGDTGGAGMTNLSVLFANVTEVVKNALPASLTSLTLNKAKTIAEQNVTLSGLTELLLPMYQFGNGVAPSTFFTTDKEGINNTLKTLDLSSVTSLCPTPGQSTSISFKNYTALETVTLNENGVQLYAEQFSGCGSLTSVKGKLNLSVAKDAFKGCGKLTKVQISGTDIPAGAFQNSGVKNITTDSEFKVAVVPTSIGANAFKDNTAIKEMDLSQANTIGAGAFDGASNFVGVPDKDHYLAVVLIVDKVEANAFNETNIASFFLQYAKSTGSNSLNSTAVKQIMYEADLDQTKAGKTDSPIATDQTGTNKDVQIFVKHAEDVALFSGYTFVMPY